MASPSKKASSLVLYSVQGQPRELPEDVNQSRSLTPLLPRQEGIHSGRFLPRYPRARFRNLLGKRDHKIDLAANLEIGVGEEIEPAVTYIPRLGVELSAFGLRRQHTHRKVHCESPRFAAVCTVTHSSPLSLTGFGAKLTPASTNCNAKFKVFCPS